MEAVCTAAQTGALTAELQKQALLSSPWSMAAIFYFSKHPNFVMDV